MQVQIFMRPMFYLQLTLEELEPILVMSKHHYDSVCRSASGPGGFLFGWYNTLSVPRLPDQTEPALCQATYRELDTLLKTCEGLRLAMHCRLITKEQMDRANHLCALAVAAMERGSIAVNEFKTITIAEPDKRAQRIWAVAPGRF